MARQGQARTSDGQQLALVTLVSHNRSHNNKNGSWMTKRERPPTAVTGWSETDGGSAIRKVPDPRLLTPVLQLISTLASGMPQNDRFEGY